MKRLVICLGLYYEDTKFKMIVERLALGMAKNLNLSVGFALCEGLKGVFETNGREEKPIIFWL